VFSCLTKYRWCKRYIARNPKAGSSHLKKAGSFAEHRKLCDELIEIFMAYVVALTDGFKNVVQSHSLLVP